MVRLKTILNKYLAKGNNIFVFNNFMEIMKLSESISDIILNPSIEIQIYFFIKEIYQVALIGVFNFTACYKCFSIKNLRLTWNEYKYYLLPLQMKLYFNYEKIYNLHKCRWMNIDNIFKPERAFVNKEKKREFKELCKNHNYFCSKLFCFFFRKIENNLGKLTNDDFKKMMGFFLEETKYFEKKLIVYSLISSKHPKAKRFLLNYHYY